MQGVLLDSDLSQVANAEYRADAAIRLTGDTLDLLLIVEIQLRKDAAKRFVWPAYLGVAHAQHRCPVGLLVITLDARTARWAAEPIRFGLGAELRPVVVGPAEVPVVTDAVTAGQSPEIAVLSAIAHGHEPVAASVGLAAADAARALDDGRARLYLDLILHFLNPAARREVEAQMIENWQPQSDFFKRLDAQARAAGLAEGRERGLELGLERGRELGREQGLEQGRELGLEQGRLHGQRALLVRQLHKRFGALPDEISARIQAASAEDLERWAEDLLDADSLSALFGALG